MVEGLDVLSFPVAGSKYSSSSVGLDVTIFPVEGSKYRFSALCKISLQIMSIQIQGEFIRTFLIASEMYLKELVALSLSFPHFRVNILTVNSQLSVT